MLTYDQPPKLNETRVYLSGKRIGTILPAKGGFQYIPKAGKKFAGEVMPTIKAVVRSLES